MSKPTMTILKTGSVGKTEVSAETLAAILDRRSITEPTAIVESMARDILAARRDGQHAVLIDLTELGWTRAQAQRFGSQAHAAALDPRVATQDAVERLAVREGKHLVAVAGIDAARITAAGEAAVAEALAVPVTGDMAQMLDDIGGDAA